MGPIGQVVAVDGLLGSGPQGHRSSHAGVEFVTDAAQAVMGYLQNIAIQASAVQFQQGVARILGAVAQQQHGLAGQPHPGDQGCIVKIVHHSGIQIPAAGEEDLHLRVAQLQFLSHAGLQESGFSRKFLAVGNHFFRDKVVRRAHIPMVGIKPAAPQISVPDGMVDHRFQGDLRRFRQLRKGLKSAGVVAVIVGKDPAGNDDLPVRPAIPGLQRPKQLLSVGHIAAVINQEAAVLQGEKDAQADVVAVGIVGIEIDHSQGGRHRTCFPVFRQEQPVSLMGVHPQLAPGGQVTQLQRRIPPAQRHKSAGADGIFLNHNKTGVGEQFPVAVEAAPVAQHEAALRQGHAAQEIPFLPYRHIGMIGQNTGARQCFALGDRPGRLRNSLVEPAGSDQLAVCFQRPPGVGRQARQSIPRSGILRYTHQERLALGIVGDLGGQFSRHFFRAKKHVRIGGSYLRIQGLIALFTDHIQGAGRIFVHFGLLLLRMGLPYNLR